METDKQQRHAHSHQPRPGHEEPASTDLADAIRDQKAADAASAHQRRHAGARPAVDERYGEGARADVHSRLVKVDVAGGRTRITIAAGQDQGIRPGMEGYIKAGEGLLAEFQIEAVEAASATASVDLAPDAVYGSSEVVVNPSSKPPPRTDIHGRILATSIEGPFVKLMIGLGATSGVRSGVPGFMHSGDGRSFADFVVGEVTARTCSAHIVSPNLDLVKAHAQVVINPTTGASAAASHAPPHHA